VYASGLVTSLALSSDSRRLLVNLGAAEIHLWQSNETGGGWKFRQRYVRASPSHPLPPRAQRLGCCSRPLSVQMNDLKRGTQHRPYSWYTCPTHTFSANL
jgi:hypothetical protein